MGSSGTGAEHLRGCAKATAGQEGGRTGLVTEASTELNCKNNKPASCGTEEFKTCPACAGMHGAVPAVRRRWRWCGPALREKRGVDHHPGIALQEEAVDWFES